MPSPHPRRRSPGVGALSLLALVLIAPVVHAQSVVELASYTEFDVLPEESGSPWSRIGEGAVVLLDDGELVLNDNSQTSLVAYRAMLGQIDGRHRVELRGRVRVLSNIGGLAAVVEVSRPGSEVLVKLFRDRLQVVERTEDRTTERWLGSAEVDLESGVDLAVTRRSLTEDPDGTVIVEVDGREVVRCRPRGSGPHQVGQVLFGSLGYADLGASGWRWIDLSVVRIEAAGSVPLAPGSIGALKGDYLR